MSEQRGHRVRIAQRGWRRMDAARNLDEVQAGVGVMWVEIDGHRFDAVVAAEVVAEETCFAKPRLILDLIGPVEIVYTDAAGRPLSPRGPRWLWWWLRLLSRPTKVDRTPRLDHRATLERQR